MNAYDKALSLLAMREHTAKEITRKLLEKGYEMGDIESAVSRLEAEGAISNKRYVESYLRSRARKGGESLCLMRMKLLDRGIDKSTLDEILFEYLEGDEYYALLKKSYRALSSKKGEDGATRSLLNKGYTLSEIKRAKQRED